ncbi:ABC transporter ATP-binding protein [Nocardia macrotermitis]|uniref:Aliphatic sulfonates import ATP-binding protein SsuB n=1 Tax=Nocardia macrotermitis TaxID=2585198 RepID=A0A7K0CY31_9NOCA|nr:ABC transporter ATP-binding protein [Nocardia macrotermitis]MQY18386.1 Aliphatic sulfonates import ATP-binding protein SsuB [Nocardia macrotermitis]
MPLTMNTAPPREGSQVLGFQAAELTYADGTVALSGVDLSVRAGEFVSVVGPSGCGKSTLLRIASGLESTTGGYTQVGANRVGYVFQDATLLPWRTVRDNVALLPELDHVGKAERYRRAASAIELVGLTGFEKHLPRRLSGGMRMRVSLARSLTIDPELFLFDEPFGALDEITRERLGTEITELFAARRFAGLFVTHSVTEAVFLSSRVAVMSGRPGRIVDEVDIPFDFPRRPEIRFTPEFAALASRISLALRGGHA